MKAGSVVKETPDPDPAPSEKRVDGAKKSGIVVTQGRKQMQKVKCIRYKCKQITMQGICDKHQAERIKEGLDPYTPPLDMISIPLYYSYISERLEVDGCRHLSRRTDAR